MSKHGVHARLRRLARAAIAALVLSIAIPMSTGARALADTGPVARQIAADGVTTAQASPLGDDAVVDIEVDDFGMDDADVANSGDEGLLGRGLPTAGAGNASTKGSQKAKSNVQVDLSFDGLNFRQQRLANGGNQFSVEPPDQALCVGNGYVLESVNDVLTRADMQNCHGCHNGGIPVGDGIQFPSGFNGMQVAEFQQRLDDGIARFWISRALLEVFAPHRAKILSDFLAGKPLPVHSDGGTIGGGRTSD